MEPRPRAACLLRDQPHDRRHLPGAARRLHAVGGLLNPPGPGPAGSVEPHVVTVLGPRPARALGPVDAHEHLFIASPAMRGGEIDDPERVIAEVREAQATGLEAFVELTPIGLGRRPELMRRVAEETGAVIIGATGYHRDEHYPPDHWVHE
ncbi:MAG TPA: hypothetical protein VN771_06420, partial [Candidatus Baltobacteraceae bacterium]|nr:hypothetical protein [Candidatus Baltobacteraceae bacterium]